MQTLQDSHDVANKLDSFAYKIVAVYDDQTIEVIAPWVVRKQLADLQATSLKIQLKKAASDFEKEIAKMSPTMMTPDNYRVKKVMQTLHRELLRLAKPKGYDIYDIFQDQQQARDTLNALTEMARDSTKADQPIAYKPPKKPITNLKIGSLLTIGTAVLLGATVVRMLSG